MIGQRVSLTVFDASGAPHTATATIVAAAATHTPPNGAGQQPGWMGLLQVDGMDGSPSLLVFDLCQVTAI